MLVKKTLLLFGKMLYSLRTLVSHVSPVVVAILHGDCEDRLQAKSNKQKQKQKQPKKKQGNHLFLSSSSSVNSASVILCFCKSLKNFHTVSFCVLSWIYSCFSLAIPEVGMTMYLPKLLKAFELTL